MPTFAMIIFNLKRLKPKEDSKYKRISDNRNFNLMDFVICDLMAKTREFDLVIVKPLRRTQ